jgi:hypothetical protein
LPVSRREALRGAAAAVAVATGAGAAAAAAESAPDVATLRRPRPPPTAEARERAARAAALSETLLVHLRLRSDLAAGRALQWYRGWVWGKRPFERAVRLFAVEGVSVNTLTLTDDGGFTIAMDEVGFWLDPATGEPADRWTNPLNGLDCEPPHFHSVYRTSYQPDGRLVARGSAWDAEGGIEPPLRSGPWIWSSESVAGSRRPAATPQQIDPLQRPPPVESVTSLATFSARAADVARPLEAWVDSASHFQSAGNFRPWMRMGQEPGVFSFQNSGRKLHGPGEIPAQLRAWINARRPGWIEAL